MVTIADAMAATPPPPQHDRQQEHDRVDRRVVDFQRGRHRHDPDREAEAHQQRHSRGQRLHTGLGGKARATGPIQQAVANEIRAEQHQQDGQDPCRREQCHRKERHAHRSDRAGMARLPSDQPAKNNETGERDAPRIRPSGNRRGLRRRQSTAPTPGSTHGCRLRWRATTQTRARKVAARLRSARYTDRGLTRRRADCAMHGWAGTRARPAGFVMAASIMPFEPAPEIRAPASALERAPPISVTAGMSSFPPNVRA